jgi:hypothetical protein
MTQSGALKNEHNAKKKRDKKMLLRTPLNAAYKSAFYL